MEKDVAVLGAKLDGIVDLLRAHSEENKESNKVLHGEIGTMKTFYMEHKADTDARLNNHSARIKLNEAWKNKFIGMGVVSVVVSGMVCWAGFIFIDSKVKEESRRQEIAIKKEVLSSREMEPLLERVLVKASE